MLKFSANFHEVISSFERIHHVKKLGNSDCGNLCIPGLRTTTKATKYGHVAVVIISELAMQR